MNVYLQSNFDKWWIRVKSNSMTKKIFYMFWINKTFINMFRINEKIIIVDYIYKSIVIECRWSFVQESLVWTRYSFRSKIFSKMKNWRITNDFLQSSRICTNTWIYRFRSYDFQTMSSTHLLQLQKKYHRSSNMLCVYDISNRTFWIIARSTFRRMKFDSNFSMNLTKRSKKRLQKSFIVYCTLTINLISI